MQVSRKNPVAKLGRPGMRKTTPQSGIPFWNAPRATNSSVTAPKRAKARSRPSSPVAKSRTSCAKAKPVRWCSTARPSMPRAAAKPATQASSRSRMAPIPSARTLPSKPARYMRTSASCSKRRRQGRREGRSRYRSGSPQPHPRQSLGHALAARGAAPSAWATHVSQKGSLVEDAYFRFDFSHNQALTADELERVEAGSECGRCGKTPKA